MTLDVISYAAAQKALKPRRTLFATLSDSLLKNGYSGSTSEPMKFADSNGCRSIPFYMTALSGGRIQLTQFGVQGLGGITSTTVRDTYLPEVLALDPRPGYCLVECGTNDSGVSIPGSGFQTTQANIVAICNALVAAGIMPVLCSLMPRGDMISSGYLVINWWIQQYAVRNGYPFIDFFSPLVDPTTNGNYVDSGDVTGGGDVLHPSAQGARKLAQSAVDQLLPILPPNGPFLPSLNDLTGAAFTSNILMLTDTDADGVPDNWSLSGTGATCAQEADTNIIGNYATVTRGSADATLTRTSNYTAAAGRRYYFACQLKSEVKAVGGSFSVVLENNDSSRVVAGVVDCTQDLPAGSVFACEFDMPSSGIGNYAFSPKVRVKGASGAKASIGQVLLHDVTSAAST